MSSIGDRRPAPTAASASCLVCGGPAEPSRSAGAPVCRRADCRQVAAEREKMHPAAFERYLTFRSERIRASVERDKARLAAEAKIREKEREENRAYWKTKLATLAGCAPEDYPLTAIPSCRRKVVNLPERRRRRFRDALNRSLSEALVARLRRPTVPDPPAAASPEKGLSVLIAKACALCAGGCCTQGANHAYLDKQALLGIMHDHPKLRPRQILDAYVSRIPHRSYADSCIFHGPQGCALPPILRSSTCSNYFCPGLKDLIAAFGGERKPEGALIVQRSREPWDLVADAGNRIVRSFVLTADRLKPL